MYQGISAITINEVINFFNYTELTQNSVHLQYLFYGCHNVEFKLNGSDDSSFTKPAVYDTFVSTLSKFISGKTINF
jgi:hypothetical protein